ncbi:MAG: Ku protein, partial [Pseudaminobacter sp.]|nr:Ku protein [Pseudaminobacter sp.]
KDDFLLIEEEDIEAVQIESSHTMNLETFVQKSEIEEIYLDTPYYLTPADEVSEEAFAVIRDALAAKKMAGLARVVLYRRERPVVIEPLGKGMLLTTLRYDNTVRKPSTAFDEIDAAKVDAEMLELATRIVKKKKTKFQPEKFEDKHQQALLDLVETKKAGRKPAKAKAAPTPSNVVNLFDALKKSLASEDNNADDEPAPPKNDASAGPAKTKAGAAKKKKSA